MSPELIEQNHFYRKTISPGEFEAMQLNPAFISSRIEQAIVILAETADTNYVRWDYLDFQEGITTQGNPRYILYEGTGKIISLAISKSGNEYVLKVGVRVKGYKIL